MVSIYIWTETAMRDMVILGHMEMALLSFLEGTACLGPQTLTALQGWRKDGMNQSTGYQPHYFPEQFKTKNNVLVITS